MSRETNFCFLQQNVLSSAPSSLDFIASTFTFTFSLKLLIFLFLSPTMFLFSFSFLLHHIKATMHPVAPLFWTHLPSFSDLKHIPTAFQYPCSKINENPFKGLDTGGEAESHHWQVARIVREIGSNCLLSSEGHKD